MAIFLDTGFYFSLIWKKDKKHHRAQEIFQEVGKGMFGAIFTSDFVLDESLTLMNIRTYGKRLDLVEKVYDLFMGQEPLAELIKVPKIWIKDIFAVQRKLTTAKDPISFTDASNIILCQKHGIKNIVAFDGHFKGFLHVIS